MTKKQACKILKKRYSNVEYWHLIPPLCHGSPIELKKDWRKYWKKINTTNTVLISDCFVRVEDQISNSTLTRLMMLHYFVEDYYE